MLRIDECNCNSITKEFKNFGSSILIHEHDFQPINIKEDKQKLIICLTCSSLYCEKCGKLLVSTTTNDKKKVIHYNNNLSIMMSKK